MRHLSKKFLFLVLIFLPDLLFAQLSGMKTIGASGNYNTIQDAFNGINSLGLSGALILEIQNDYNPAGETFPLLPGVLTGSSDINTVTLRPAIGVTNILLESNAVQTLNLSGTNYLIIDGRPGGTGTSKEITFSNSNPNANTIRFINESSNNIIKYCKVKGDEMRSDGSLEFGIINIGTSSGMDGNDNILIDNCNVFNYSTGASRLIYIKGTDGKNNDSISITNCNLYNFVNRAIETSDTGVGDRIVITGNSIYEPSDLIFNNILTYGIYIIAGGNHDISGNYIGGKEALCGGSPLNTTLLSFTALSVNISTSLGSVIQNNVVQNISVSGTNSAFIGVEVLSGNINISNNIIGSDLVSNSITVTGNFSTSAIVVNGAGDITISNNLIANINASGSGSSTNARGIASIGGTGERIITNNIIHDLTSAGNNTNQVNLNATAVGIGIGSSNTVNMISKNQVYSIRSIRVASTNAVVFGIIVISGGGKILANRVYDLTNTCTGSSASIIGVFGTAGNWEVVNNQICLTNGSITSGNVIRGIRVRNASSSIVWKIYYNSVFISGSAASGAHSSSALFKELANTVDAANNIFYNSRAGGTGKHYSIDYTGNTTVTSNYNLIVGLSSTLIKWGTTDYNFADYKINSGLDLYSYSEQPANISSPNLFVNTAAGNLNIQSSNSEAFFCDGKGIPISGYADDYSSIAIRDTSVTQGTTDIGSDEFVYSGSIPNLTESGPPALNTATTYSFAGRDLCSITWGNSGTVPTLFSMTYQAGIDPPGTPSNQYSKAMWDVTASGGSGYTYDITFNYTPAILNNIANENNLKLAKRDAGIWSYLSGAIVNTSAKTAAMAGLNSFSQFTLTSSDDPLPVELSSFSSLALKNEVVLDWSTVSEVNNRGFEVERKIASSSEWRNISFVNGAGNSDRIQNYKFTDRNLQTGRYNFRLKQIDFNGNFHYYYLNNEVEIEIPFKYSLGQNYPNPFNPTTKINYELPKDGLVILRIYDLTGRQVTELVNQRQLAGYYTVNFNSSNLPSGTYFYKLQIGDFISTKKMVLLK